MLGQGCKPRLRWITASLSCQWVDSQQASIDAGVGDAKASSDSTELSQGPEVAAPLQSFRPINHQENAMNDVATVNKDKLMNDLRVVIADAEELLKVTADQAGEGAAEMRGRVQARMAQAKADLARLQETALNRAKAAGHAADEFVHVNPWKSISMAAGVGIVVGLLAARR